MQDTNYSQNKRSCATGPREPRSQTKSIRFPNEVIAEVEAAIQGTDCTFTHFVVEAVRAALDGLKEDGT